MKESTQGFEFCFDEKTEELCTKDIKTGKITKIPEELLEENINKKEVDGE